MSETLTPAQRRTLPARQALAAKFASTAEKTEYFRELARRSHERRLTLSGDEATALLAAYTLLGSHRRARSSKQPTHPSGAWMNESDPSPASLKSVEFKLTTSTFPRRDAMASELLAKPTPRPREEVCAMPSLDECRDCVQPLLENSTRFTTSRREPDDRLTGRSASRCTQARTVQGAATDRREQKRNRSLSAIESPSCLHQHMASGRLRAETSRRAAQRPVTLEIIHVCPHCRALLVLSLMLVSEHGGGAR